MRRRRRPCISVEFLFRAPGSGEAGHAVDRGRRSHRPSAIIEPVGIGVKAYRRGKIRTWASAQGKRRIADAAIAVCKEKVTLR